MPKLLFFGSFLLYTSLIVSFICSYEPDVEVLSPTGSISPWKNCVRMGFFSFISKYYILGRIK